MKENFYHILPDEQFFLFKHSDMTSFRAPYSAAVTRNIMDIHFRDFLPEDN